MNSTLFYSVTVLFVLVMGSVAQDEGPDEAHECEMYRKCKDCSTMEYCVKLGNAWLQRWWVGCPFWAQHCNPYSQSCQATITPICQSLQPSTPSG